jgi:hypothetical protein
MGDEEDEGDKVVEEEFLTDAINRVSLVQTRLIASL